MKQNFDYVTIYQVLCPSPVHDFHLQDNGEKKATTTELKSVKLCTV